MAIRFRSAFRPAALAAVFAFVASTLPVAAQTTVVVSPVPANPTASGAALLAALAGIVDNSSTKPYLIKIEPGIYDLKLDRLVMKPFIDIEGSGQQVTVIRGGGNVDFDLNDGVVRGVSRAELRELHVQVIGSAARPYAIAIYNQLAAPSLRNLKVTASGGTVNWGIRNHSSSPTIEECNITAAGGTFAYGVANSGASPGARPILRRSVITAGGATTSYGIYNDQLSLARELREVEIVVTGITNSYGFYAQVDFGAGAIARLNGSTITAHSASNTNTAVRFAGGGGVDLFVEQSQLRGQGGVASRGIDLLSGALTVDHAELGGATHSLRALVADPVRVGASRLAGPRSLGVSAICAASYDGSFAPVACP